MDNPASTRSELLQMWAIQSNLIMMYRSIFLTLITVLVASGALLLSLGETLKPFVGLAGCGAGLVISIAWFALQWQRGSDINYLRARLIWAETCKEQTLVSKFRVGLDLDQWRRHVSKERQEIVNSMTTQSSEYKLQ